MTDSQSKPNTDDFFDKAADFLLSASWVAAVLWFLGMIGYQTVHWLRFGEWQAVSLIAALEYFGLNLNFIYDPQSWIGLAHIAQWFLSLPLSLVGAFLIVLSASLVRTFLRGDV